MSELKGQLLGIILVISVFGVLLGILTAAFQHSAETIQSRVEEAAYTNSDTEEGPEIDPNGRVGRNYKLVY